MHGSLTVKGGLVLVLLLGFLASSAVAAPESDLTSGHAKAQSETIETADSSPLVQHRARTFDASHARVLLFSYCLMIVAASFCGGWLPFAVELTHKRMQMMISLVGGLMLGIAVFHLLPHAVIEISAYTKTGALDIAVGWLMAGLLIMFFLIRTFHFHQHDVIDLPGAPGSSGDEHDHDCSHHHHGHTQHRVVHTNPLSWVGVAVGLALHTLIDGLALGASIRAEAGHGTLWSLYGLGTFAAILLHKPLDAISITSLMAAGGWSARWRHAVNGGFALMCPIGAALFFLGVDRFSQHQHLLIGSALAFSAGVFLCISLGDLLPELEFHAHDRLKLSIMLLLGIALAYGIGFLEPKHAHAPRKVEKNVPAENAIGESPSASQPSSR